MKGKSTDTVMGRLKKKTWDLKEKYQKKDPKVIPKIKKKRLGRGALGHQKLDPQKHRKTTNKVQNPVGARFSGRGGPPGS